MRKNKKKVSMCACVGSFEKELRRKKGCVTRRKEESNICVKIR
jgi:hypothetical protein